MQYLGSYCSCRFGHAVVPLRTVNLLVRLATERKELSIEVDFTDKSTLKNVPFEIVTDSEEVLFEGDPDACERYLRIFQRVSETR